MVLFHIPSLPPSYYFTSLPYPMVSFYIPILPHGIIPPPHLHFKIKETVKAVNHPEPQ